MTEWILVSFDTIEYKMRIKLTFLGAARNVTGSRFLIEANGFRFLIDCGLHQERELRHRDWDPFPVPPGSIDAVILTHAHLDHCGYLPKLVKNGFKNKIYCTSATAGIVEIMLYDSAKIQQQDAENKKKRHERRKKKAPYPEMPLYTTEDVEECLSYFSPVPFRDSVKLTEGVTLTFYEAGHVLGAASIEIRLKQDGEERILLFSGDIGRRDRPILRDPAIISEADYVLIESTYGDREIEPVENTFQEFIDIVNSTIQAGGNVIIPTFALERAQDVLYCLSEAMNTKKIPSVPVFLDSPMAVNITKVFMQNINLFDNETKELLKQKKSPFDFPDLKMMASVEESKQIDRIKEPIIVLAGSGMCTGGRIKYHLISNISKKESTILFVGYQAVGTLGRLIVNGDKKVRILGDFYPVKARVVQLNGFSSHADKKQLLQWLSNLNRVPRHVFVVHGEEEAANHLAQAIRDEKGWKVSVPDYLDEIIID